MIIKKAYAKINLTLEIGEKKENGYHLLTSVMARATLADTVSIEKNTTGKINFKSTEDEINAEDNLCTRAAVAYFNAKGITGQGVDILLEANIPVASGMGGGSADCAATLECMEGLFGALDDSTRHEVALSLGADVPYCLKKTPCFCQGVGDICHEIDCKALDGLWLVISKVGQKQSTGKVYSDFDALAKSGREYDHTKAVKALEAGDIHALAANTFNDFERVVFPISPDVTVEKERLLAAGALSVVMSGAGPALVAFFDDKEKAKACGTVYEIII